MNTIKKNIYKLGTDPTDTPIPKTDKTADKTGTDPTETP